MDSGIDRHESRFLRDGELQELESEMMDCRKAEDLVVEISQAIPECDFAGFEVKWILGWRDQVLDIVGDWSWDIACEEAFEEHSGFALLQNRLHRFE